MRNVRYCVVSGPDASHLHDVHWEDKYRDAKKHSENLELPPVGKERPFRIERHDFSIPDGIKVLDSNYKILD